MLNHLSKVGLWDPLTKEMVDPACIFENNNLKKQIMAFIKENPKLQGNKEQEDDIKNEKNRQELLVFRQSLFFPARKSTENQRALTSKKAYIRAIKVRFELYGLKVPSEANLYLI